MPASVWTRKMSGMKKMLLATAVGLTGLLASCGSTSTPGISGFNTNYHLSANVKDQSGNTIPAGTAVICDNVNTTIGFNVQWSGDVTQIQLQLKGYNSGAYRDIGNYAVNSSAGSAYVEYVIGSGLAPLNVKPQSIVVNPVSKVTVKGYTYVRARGYSPTGGYSEVAASNYSIPVVNCF